MTSRPGDNEITQERGDIGSGTYREPVFSQTCSLFPKKMVPEDLRQLNQFVEKVPFKMEDFDSNTVSPPEGGIFVAR